MSESEIIRFIQTCLIVYACLAYTYAVGKVVPPGKVRSLLILPVVALFFLLPLRLNSGLCALTALFITWVGSFKLAIFSFGKGPLATDHPVINFSQFMAIGFLPIILTRKSKFTEKKTIDDTDPSVIGLVFTVKSVLFALIYNMFKFEAHLHPLVIFYMYGMHIYLTLEFITFGIRAVAGPLLGLELDLPFDEPILSTSVQNFWGRRWNLAVGSILRECVYDPMRATLKPYLGSKQAQQLSVIATFGTSALMHEIIFYYLSRKQPTWDMTWYFLLQGVIVVLETDVKRLVGQKWQPPRLVSTAWTITLISGISLIVFFPKIYYCNGHVQTAEEIAPFETFLKSVGDGLMLSSFKGVCLVCGIMFFQFHSS